MKDISVVIPVYNEESLIEGSLRRVLSVFDKSKLNYEIVVVDDGSTDKSYKLIRKFHLRKEIRVIRHKRNRGHSAAVRSGICAASGRYIGYLDADLQYDICDMIRFYKCAKKFQLGLLCGMYGKIQYAWIRRFLSKFRNFLTCYLFKIPRACDVNSMKLFDATILSEIDFSNEKEVVGLEVILGAQRLGCKIFSLPIVVGKRLKGKSHFGFKLIFRGVMGLSFFYLKYLRERKKKRKPKICLSFDVEEFNVPSHYGIKHPQNGNTKFSEIGLGRISNLFKDRKIVGTFFSTGYYASREPESIKSIQKQGNEIGCHSYYDISHKKLSCEKIGKQISSATKILTNVCGKRPLGFRTPLFSVNKYVYDRLIDEGYLYDSSSHPAIVFGRYLNFSDSLYPSIVEKNSKSLVVFPVSVIPVIRFPISWWWMRNLGLWLTIFGTKINLKMGHDVVLYFHPWEFVELPKIKGFPSSIVRGTGKKNLLRLGKFIVHFQKKGYDFVTLSSMIK